MVAGLLLLGMLQLQAQEENVYDTTATIASPEVESYVDSVVTAANENSAEPDSTNTTLYFEGKENPRYLYDSSVVEFRSIPDSIVDALKADEDFWYANMVKEEQKPRDLSWLESLLEFLFNAERLIWIILGLLVFAALMWFLANNKMNIFGRSRTTVNTLNHTGGDEQYTQPQDLPLAIQQAVADKNYRLATRYYYILLLQKLAEAGHIKYKEDTTNMQYLTQVYSKSFYKDFFSVTRHYEYVWYGEMPIDETIYKAVEAEFASLLNHPSI